MNTQDYFANVPKELINFLLVGIFSLLIGLSQKRLRINSAQSVPFGTDRTFTFIGILGYLLYIISPNNLWLYAGGGLALTLFLALNYYQRMVQFQKFGMTSIFIALITYCLPPIVVTQPSWLYILVVVVVLLLSELKETFSNFAKQIRNDEFTTLAKFMIIAGIILPILPKEPIIEGSSLTPYSIWLATVIVSAVSYASYLLNKFVFKDSGVIVSGILGGLYSSTATTIVLAKKSRGAGKHRNQYLAAIFLATAMMYVRILVLMFIFNADVFRYALPCFLIMLVVSAAVAAGAYYYKRPQGEVDTAEVKIEDKNPLEFKVSLIFSLLFVLFTIITQYVVNNFGASGLNIMSFVVGVTDVSPFLINLFQGDHGLTVAAIAAATFRSTISNNLVKLGYSIFFSGKEKGFRNELIVCFSIITVANIILLFFI